jgi:hypothetical protein
MKKYRMTTGPAILALLALGYLATPKALKAADSAEVTKLLADAKAEAVELKADAEGMDSFTRSAMNWQSYASKLSMIKEHVNNSGKLLAKLKNAEATGSDWQRAAIKQIEPLLREMADNTEATIKHLSDNPAQVHMQQFKDYVKANYELATDLEALIRDFVDYGNAKDKYESLGSRLELHR